ncbi:hypothetical protein [Streptomyces sp. NBC_01443]|uniref:hypothetical protein n=1 Tax=Streptomyces sp. NBC_01443 TaxID=2903868 RepID=UPI00225289C7|nr:hypothetical protein [Streptomyces sp. NBC_01443]MCX4632521.1 hypothetical protein [Streptomyces sp. NBC_01443]
MPGVGALGLSTAFPCDWARPAHRCGRVLFQLLEQHPLLHGARFGKPAIRCEAAVLIAVINQWL